MFVLQFQLGECGRGESHFMIYQEPFQAPFTSREIYRCHTMVEMNYFIVRHNMINEIIFDGAEHWGGYACPLREDERGFCQPHDQCQLQYLWDLPNT